MAYRDKPPLPSFISRFRLLDYVRGDGGEFKFFKLQKREKRKGEGREYLIHTELICTIFSTSNSQ
jgi:hypothetical protein